jgi:hypothetical protein
MITFELINYFLGLLLISASLIFILKLKVSFNFKTVLILLIAFAVYFLFETPDSLILIG